MVCLNSSLELHSVLDFIVLCLMIAVLTNFNSQLGLILERKLTYTLQFLHVDSGAAPGSQVYD